MQCVDYGFYGFYVCFENTSKVVALNDELGES